MIIGATFFVAYANGANDNFKGVATLFGSGTTDYHKALLWATVMTFLGSLTAVFVATELVKNFSGSGLVPDRVVSNPMFMVAVIGGAGLTVFIASKTGLPISTTHSLTGALLGCGFLAAGNELNLAVLGKKFFLPLLVSPFLAMGLTALFYPLFRWGREKSGVNKETCLCVGEKVIPAGHLALAPGQMISTVELRRLDIFVDEKEVCEAKAVEMYAGKIFGLSVQKVLDGLHFLSAGAVSFARGLNDTPKIVALAVAGSVLGLRWSVGLVAVMMAVGAVLGARKVAETMSHRLTAMNHGQGLTANLVTSALVIFASRLGLPVSTTHVSCGSLFGIGLVNGRARWKVIAGVVSAWVFTLPVAAALAGLIFWLLKMKS